MEKRVLTIQDFSCLGRCSLTVALPTLSAAKVECVALPTAVLSNHTAFPSWTFHDLTDEIFPITKKWEEYGQRFDYIYTGYLTTKQIPLVLDIIERFKTERTTIVIDPAMADHGKLYPGFPSEHIIEMRKLIAKADIIIPNLTEACLLTDTPYWEDESDLTNQECLYIATKLMKMGAKKIIVSGLETKDGHIRDAYADEGKSLSFYETEKYAGLFHGTGDLFASAFVGALASGASFSKAIAIAHDFVHEAIRISNENGIDGLTQGPDFESALPYYIALLEGKERI